MIRFFLLLVLLSANLFAQPAPKPTDHPLLEQLNKAIKARDIDLIESIAAYAKAQNNTDVLDQIDRIDFSAFPPPPHPGASQ